MGERGTSIQVQAVVVAVSFVHMSCPHSGSREQWSALPLQSAQSQLSPTSQIASLLHTGSPHISPADLHTASDWHQYFPSVHVATSHVSFSESHWDPSGQHAHTCVRIRGGATVSTQVELLTVIRISP